MKRALVGLSCAASVLMVAVASASASMTCALMADRRLLCALSYEPSTFVDGALQHGFEGGTVCARAGGLRRAEPSNPMIVAMSAQRCNARPVVCSQSLSPKGSRSSSQKREHNASTLTATISRASS